MARPEVSAALSACRPLVEGKLAELIQRFIPDQTTGTCLLVELVIGEFAELFRTGTPDARRLRAIASAHVRIGLEPKDIDPIYRIVGDALRIHGLGEELVLLERHQLELSWAYMDLLQQQSAVREAFQQAVVELANEFDHLIALEEPKMIDRIVQLVQSSTASPLVYFARSYRGSDSRVVIESIAGPARGYAEDLILSTDPSVPEGRGPIGHALRSGKIQVVAKPNDPLLTYWVERLSRFGLGCSVTLPFEASFGRRAALAIYRSGEEDLSCNVEDLAEALSAQLAQLFLAKTQAELDRHRRAVVALKADLVKDERIDAEEVIGDLIAKLCDRRVTDQAALFICRGEKLVCTRCFGMDDLADQVIGLEIPLVDARAAGVPLADSFLYQEELITEGVVPRDMRDLMPQVVMERTAGRLVIRRPLVLMGETVGVVMYSLHDEPDLSISAALPAEISDLLAMALDHLERNRATYEANWLADLDRTLLHSSIAMANVQSEEEMMQSVTNALVENKVFDAAWVGRPGTNRLDPIAGAGSGIDDLQGVDIPLDYPGDGPLVLRALRNNHPLVSDDLQAELEMKPWLDFLRGAGWRSGAAFPIHREGRIWGVLAVTSSRSGVFTEAVMAALSTAVTMIEQGLAEMALKSHLARERQKQYVAARTDSLTGLANRLAFEEAVQALLAESRPIAVGILDLDGFKELNDLQGHFAGDRLLKRLGSKFLTLMREGVLVSRLGGDEFGFVVADSDPYPAVNEIVESANSILLELGWHQGITGSFGWAVYPDDAGDYGGLLSRADAALYAAKAAGRARSMFWGGEIAGLSEARKTVRTRFPIDLVRKQVDFHLQPKIDATSGRVKGAEILLRWSKAPLPAVIDELRTDATMARNLGRRVMEFASEAMAQISRSYARGIELSFNITPSHFLSPEFIADIEEVLDRSIGTYTVEITEDVALGDFRAAGEVITALHELNVRVSLDDFGTRYASLANIATLEVDELKVDRSFITRFRTDVNAFAVVSSLSVIGKVAQVDLVAEGVENRLELDGWLRLGGRLIQGYLYARPQPLEELLSQLRPGRFGKRSTPAYPWEDLVAISEAICGLHLSRALSGFSCPLNDWFRERRWRWSELDSWSAAEALHTRLHEKFDAALSVEFVQLMEELRDEMDRDLNARGNSG
jgi:diguanylate cyclase (GGDEF)-like protein